jgi:hypothetical protein
MVKRDEKRNLTFIILPKKVKKNDDLAEITQPSYGAVRGRKA